MEECLEEEMNEVRRIFQDDNESLLLDLEEAWDKIKKEQESFELQLRENKAGDDHIREEMEVLVKERDEILQKILEKDNMLKEMKEEMENLNKTDKLKKETGKKKLKKLKLFPPQWFQKKDTIEERQKMEKQSESERLKLQKTDRQGGQ
ncbi:uncharacterized protein LOC108275660 [Ictalurus punctatus]|uniref:Uncharacterized protein LOC108275660 n=1 Tax=Ictalurus punctatus TaxID=7998 RepID=A0A2D0SH71_ICTPU|nr:uncharacterized protein LOC108275660 [Ictalurus punctatus]XP_017342069.1 uncharacterized protein LOC108275660 [Ictalurus punctatus]XP_017342078.1 uncharacterized protein LOC108275660 [Ictalurus punctatus]